MKMKKSITLFGLFILLSTGVYCQNDTTKTTTVSNFKNNVSLELMGTGGLYALKYDRLFHRSYNPKSFFPISSYGFQLGFTQLTNFAEDNINGTRVSAMFICNSPLFNSKKITLEVGIGIAPTIEETSYIDLISSVNIKYQSVKGFSFKIGFADGAKFDNTSRYILPSLSFGYSF